jgi:uncharacterized protein with LGFP repeats
MSWAKAKGIMGSYSDGKFQPSTALTRDAMAVYFHNYDDLFGNRVPATYTDIDKKYDAVNGPVLLGSPSGSETNLATDSGKYRCYAKGCILWSPNTGATLSMSGPIRDKWASLGFETGFLGYPTNDGVTGLTDGGASQTFEHGTIVWSPSAGAHVSIGGIRSQWLSDGAESGWIGYPTTDEIYGMKNDGARQNYEGGYIYWSPMYGAFNIHGAIGSSWIARGAENSKYGYPTSNEYWWNGIIRQDFQGGYITWTTAGAMYFS